MAFNRVHQCTLGLGSESMLSKTPNETWISKACRMLRKQIMVSERHPHIFSYFLSHRALLSERKRHVLENRNIIHPLSMFSLIWRSFMIIINLSHIGHSSLALCIVTDPFKVTSLGDIFRAIIHGICVVDMIIWFNTGYINQKTDEIVLNRKRIAREYFSSFWVPDLLSSVPATLLLYAKVDCYGYQCLIGDLLSITRVIRIVTLLNDLKTFSMLLTNLHIWHRMISHTILFVLLVHCFTCLLYVPSVVSYYIYGKIPPSLAGFLDTRDKIRVLTDLSISERYLKGMFVALSAFFSTGFTMYETNDYSEIIIRSILMLFGTMFKMYAIVFALKTYMTMYNLSMRYQELMDQVEKYIHQQQFPASLSRRLRDFYWYRFQERYYKEKQALSCLSEQLQNEILLYTYKTLVDKTPVLQNLPPDYLGTILGCLQYEVYMPNDLIFHSGDEGKDMYFIFTGTVTLYTLKGVELYHLEDGDFFGALTLLKRDCRRLSTTIAIEISQIYRMSGANFRKHVMTNPELLERIKWQTTHRIDYLYAQNEGLDVRFSVGEEGENETSPLQTAND